MFIDRPKVLFRVLEVAERLKERDVELQHLKYEHHDADVKNTQLRNALRASCLEGLTMSYLPIKSNLVQPKATLCNS